MPSHPRYGYIDARVPKKSKDVRALAYAIVLARHYRMTTKPKYPGNQIHIKIKCREYPSYKLMYVTN